MLMVLHQALTQQLNPLQDTAALTAPPIQSVSTVLITTAQKIIKEKCPYLSGQLTGLASQLTFVLVQV